MMNEDWLNRIKMHVEKGWPISDHVIPDLIDEIEKSWMQLMEYQVRTEYEIGFDAGIEAANKRWEELMAENRRLKEKLKEKEGDDVINKLFERNMQIMINDQERG